MTLGGFIMDAGLKIKMYCSLILLPSIILSFNKFFKKTMNTYLFFSTNWLVVANVDQYMLFNELCLLLIYSCRSMVTFVMILYQYMLGGMTISGY